MVLEAKKETVKDFVHLLDSYPVIGIVNMENLPTKQLQKMRAKLRDTKIVLRMTKKRLMKIAYSQSKKHNIMELQKYSEGMPALVFTTENPFRLCSELAKSKSKAPAKAGQKAPRDISVSAGPTSFTPGPVISQLGKYGIKTGIEGGKIVIKQDGTVVRKGETISAELAGILARLGIEPMEIGLNLTAVYENGTVYTSDVLLIDETEYANKIATAYSDSLNLAVYVAYPTKETITILLGKVHHDSVAVAVSGGILTSETTQDIIRKAYLEMQSLSNILPALSGETKTDS